MRKKITNFFFYFTLLLLTVVLIGCKTTRSKKVQDDIYASMQREAEWILRGEPIEFEGEKWYPADGVEILLETEVYPLGQYRGVRFFIDKVDVRPYARLYTKFNKNKYRYFQQKSSK